LPIGQAALATVQASTAAVSDSANVFIFMSRFLALAWKEG
jgi:hypothetical protein